MCRTTLREMISARRQQRDSPAWELQTPPSREPEGGDIIVVGRNTFKEVLRGIHEGYLLPSDYVQLPPPAESPQDEEEKKTEEPTSPSDPVLPAIPGSQYSALPDPLRSDAEYTFTYIPSVHILGIRHTPRRIYRFLTRRYLANEICEQVVASILEQERREWSDEDSRHGVKEEKYWPKIIKRDAEWREEIAVDSRIQPKLFWRQPSEVEEIPDYRELSAPETPLKVEELKPTEDEIERDRILEEQYAKARDARTIFTGPNPWASK